MSEPRVPPTSPPRRAPHRTSAMTRVIYIVGAALILAVAVMGLLALMEKPIPDPISAVSGGALTGLVALLAKRDADA